MKSIFRVMTIIFAVLFLIFVSIVSISSSTAVDENITVATLIAASPAAGGTGAQARSIDELPLQDNQAIYQNDDPASVVTLFLTIRKGNSSDDTDHTWEQINDFTRFWGLNDQAVVVEKTEAIVQFGDENGPLPGEVGYGASTPNATIQVRGAMTSPAPQRSYKVELFDSAGAWRRQSTINLNKHVFDSTRYRNKLSFDLLKAVPDMLSLRTQFFHVYVKDETSDPSQIEFVDYGLFTQVEQPNKRYLESRFLDSEGQLYKASGFEFYRYPDEIRLVDDPLYDKDAFALRLEIKGNKDHTKLVQMLDDVNDENLPIEQTFGKYFNSDNYFTWMAFNILVGNIDARSQNFYLYSPKNGTKWYFIPWDYDGAFPLRNQPDLASNTFAPWENGVSNYWDVVLHRRVLQVRDYRTKLDEKILELKEILTAQRMENLINLYQPTVDKYTQMMPDNYYMPVNIDTSRQIARLIPDDVETNYELYVESLKKPLPFYLGIPKVEEGKLSFSWDESYDFDGRGIDYHFIVARDWAFEEVVYDQILKNATSVQIDIPNFGKYFWGVTATNQSGDDQLPYNTYYDPDSQPHPGVKRFYVTPTGEVLE